MFCIAELARWAPSWVDAFEIQIFILLNQVNPFPIGEYWARQLQRWWWYYSASTSVDDYNDEEKDDDDDFGVDDGDVGVDEDDDGDDVDDAAASQQLWLHRLNLSSCISFLQQRVLTIFIFIITHTYVELQDQ